MRSAWLQGRMVENTALAGAYDAMGIRTELYQRLAAAIPSAQPARPPLPSYLTLPTHRSPSPLNRVESFRYTLFAGLIKP